MSERERPEGVPADAWWDDEDSEWVAGRLVDGKRHGPFRFWRPDGSLCCENVYVEGTAHGPYTRFHQNGEWSQRGQLFEGKRHGECGYQRSTGETTELTFPEGTPDVLWSSTNVLERGVLLSSKFFDRDGNEVDLSGAPVESRPEVVPASARWDHQTSMWREGPMVDGAGTPVGTWKWWDTEGTLRRHAEHDSEGKVLSDIVYNDDGSVRAEVIDGADGRVSRRYHDNGALFVERRKTPEGKESFKTFWNEDGVITEQVVTEWDGEDVVARAEKGHGGQLLFDARSENGALSCTLYFEDGSPRASGSLRDGALAGTWKLFERDGSVRRQIEVDELGIEASGPDLQTVRWAVNNAAFAALVDPSAEVPELAGVDEIDWASVEGAYDDEVEQIPDLLRGLVSDEPFARDYALGSIAAEIEHQGSVYTATARVVPFYANLLAHPNSDTRSLIETLYEVGAHARPYAVEAQQARDAGDDETWIEAILGTLEGLGAAWPKIRPLLDSDDSDLRRQAILLAPFAADLAGAREDVAAVASDTNGPVDVRACAVEAISDMAGAEPDHLLPFMSSDEPLVKAVAAIAAGRSFGPNNPDAVADALHEVLRGWRDVADDYLSLPFVDVHILALLALAAGSIRSPRAQELSKPLCAHLGEVSAFSAVPYGRGLLALALGRGELPFSDDFVDVLDTLAASERFFAFVNANEVLDSWNLPRGRAELVALVAELRAAADAQTHLHRFIHGEAP